MRRRGGVLVVLGVAVIVAGGAGCSGGDDVEIAGRAEGDAGQVGSRVRDQRSTLRAAARDGAALVRTLGCAGCHVGVVAPDGPVARPLVARDPGRDPASTFVFLRDSPRDGRAGEAHLPSFHLDDAEALALSLYLASAPAGDDGARHRFDAARASHTAIDTEDGARIFRALNCAVCHQHDGIGRRRNGPPLLGVTSRLRPAALRDFLLDPRAVRPFGFEPGSGGRMPDFVLATAEVDSIVAYLRTLSVQFEADALPESVGALSAFSIAKARALLDRKLSCLGCHAWDGDGGRVGPDLALAGERLTPEYLAAIISDPRHAMPGTVMPRAALPRPTRDLILAFLASGGEAVAADTNSEADSRDEDGAGVETRGAFEDTPETERAGYLSLIDHPITYPPGPGVTDARPPSDAVSDPAARTYAAQCAMCHGADGRGDGYNARYLRARPAVHASADAMSRRPDDTLFDGIHAGGAILGGSAEMPAFGESLSPLQIEGLVDYIRKLCGCRQPAWAEDGGE